MSVRLGINPITWTNDDVPELGGDTPLETCLAETRLAGYAGTELGGKFPRDSQELRRGPGRARPRPGLWLVRRPHAGARRRGRVRCGAAAPDAPARSGLPPRRLRRHVAPGRERSVGADLAPAAAGRGRLARLRPQAHRARRAHGRLRRRHGLPPPHGHHRRERRGGGAADAAHRAGGRPALRHRPLRLCRRRPGGAGAAPCRPDRRTSTARTPAPRCWRAPGPRI